MKKILAGVSVVFLGCIIAFGLTFLPEKIDIDSGNVSKFPPHPNVEGVLVKGIQTANISSVAAFAYRGGSFTEPRTVNVGSVLVEHPKGKFLFDAGLGKNIIKHRMTAPWLMRALSELDMGKSAAQQLREAGISFDEIKGIYLTHAHWDHVSGVEDLKGIPVLLPPAEVAYMKIGGEPTKLARDLIKDNYKVYKFNSGPYMGFKKSHDVFGDGTVVIVPSPGHTPGSILTFINASGGKRYALIGDTAWQNEGVEIPTEKPWISRKLVDHDAKGIRGQLAILYSLKRNNPELVIVPAHEPKAWAGLLPL